MTHITEISSHYAPARAQLMASMLFCATYSKQYLDRTFEYLHVGTSPNAPCALLRFEQMHDPADAPTLREERAQTMLFIPITPWDERRYVVALGTHTQTLDELAAHVQQYVDNSGLNVRFMRICRSTYKLSTAFKEDEADLAAHHIAHIHPAIDMVMMRIREQYATDLALCDLAAYCCLTEPYLCKLFKQTTGMTLTQYIKMIRIENAQKLLALKKYNVHQISQMVGYKSEAYFFRIFKEYTGYTPRIYATIR